jgi:hypothetical protein
MFLGIFVMSIRISRGQVSLFVIIAVVIVLSVISFFIFTSDSVKIFKDEKSSYKVKEFVEGCLELETKVAIEEIGMHGGWLYHREMIFTNRSMADVYNENAKGLNYFGVEIPYWYYFDDSNEEFKTNIPDYDSENEYSLKNQVKRYLEENLERNCIKGFSAFEDVYEIEYEPKAIKDKIEVEFDDEEIISSLDLDLEIYEINKNNTEYVDYFESEVENKLIVPYYLARDIISSESQTSFIEKKIIDFIVMYQSSDRRDLLPPFYDFSMKYDFEPWDLVGVEKLIRRIVESHIGEVQFLNTDYDEQELPAELQDNDFAKGFVKIFLKDYLSDYSLVKDDNEKVWRDFDEYKVKPQYGANFFPSSIDISPSMGDVILLPRPEAVISFIPFFFTEYVGVYELTMPILFEIKSNSINDKFVFNLVIETNIDHNSPLRENKDIDFENPFLSDNQKSLICDPTQFISDYVYLNISDPVNYGKREYGDPQIGVEDAIVTFDCKGLASCYMGKTKINGDYIQKNNSQLKLRLPINCNPGTLEVYKHGHKKLIIENLNPGLDGEINLGEKIMPSKKTINLTARLLEVGRSKLDPGRVASDNEQGFLIFTNLEDEEIVEVIEFNSDNMEDLTIDLTIGNYSVEGFVMYNKSFTIPEEEICYDKMFDEDCHTVPELNFDSWAKGGIEIDRFEVTEPYLLKRDDLVIKVTDFGIPKNYDDLKKMSREMSDVKKNSYPLYFD